MWIDDIEETYFQWLYEPIFPKEFRGNILYENPYIVKLHHLLTKGECERLIDVAERKCFEPSTILLDGKLKVDRKRTSETAYLTKNGCSDGPYEKTIENLLRRICVLTGCSTKQFEGLMVVKYQQGQEFKNHVDYFDPVEDEKAIEDGGQRIATLFLWLNDLEEDNGGSTTFPLIGLKCIPDQGSGLFWWNQYGDKLLSDTEHQGTTLKKGVKYGLNVWIRFPGW